MVAIVKLTQPAPARKPEERSRALAKLKLLHNEAEETARLSNLLGRSAYAGIALPFLAFITMGLAVEMSPAPQLIWFLFVSIVTVALLASYRHAMKRPFEREALKDYAKDLSAILLFAGFAWGSGAFLALPSATTGLGAVLFAMLPAAIIGYLLRDRDALFLFLAPVTALTVAACLLKPFDGRVWTAVFVVLTAAAVTGATHLVERLTGIPSKPAMLSLP